jgi:ABC-type lipoprotein release transport system permease subunit
MEIDWAPRPLELAGALAATVALSVVAGLVASARALAAKPLEVLRSE